MSVASSTFLAFVPAMALAASFAYGNALLPASSHTELVCTEQSELPNDSYMLKLQLKVCESEDSEPRKTGNINMLQRMHPQPQLQPLRASRYPRIAPAPAPIMQLQPWQRPETPQIPQRIDRPTEYSHPQAAQDSMHPSHQRHYPNVHRQPVSYSWHSPSSSSASSTPSPPRPPPCPPPHYIRRTVPQPNWDPYAHGRSPENAREVVIHHFPNGVTPLDTARISFDLRGMRPGTGIPLSKLTAEWIDDTMRLVDGADAPIYVYRQNWSNGAPVVASDGLYSYLKLCMSVRLSFTLSVRHGAHSPERTVAVLS